MIFESLVTRPLELLSLSAESHAALNSTMMSEIAEALQRDAWTCSHCRTQLNEMCEVHHAGGHSAVGKDKLVAICQFCHCLEHPLWAGMQSMLIPICAPDIEQGKLFAMSWTYLAHQGNASFRHDPMRFQRAIVTRRKMAEEYLGTTHCEGLFEAVIDLNGSNPSEQSLVRLKEMDRVIRFVPNVLFSPTEPIMTWTRSGFRPVDDGWRAAVWPDKLPDPDQLRAAGVEMLRQIRPE